MWFLVRSEQKGVVQHTLEVLLKGQCHLCTPCLYSDEKIKNQSTNEETAGTGSKHGQGLDYLQYYNVLPNQDFSVFKSQTDFCSVIANQHSRYA
ncbi:P protein [Bienertia sinuspersici]